MTSSSDNLKAFRTLCEEHGITATHQRHAIYECILESPDHPTPDILYERVRRKVPMISLATVYKCVHTFLAAGILQEASPHHGSVRIDPNLSSHHHLLCKVCGSLEDIPQESFETTHILKKIPRGFQPFRVVIEIQGVCSNCKGAR